jgi:hypothetical protein
LARPSLHAAVPVLRVPPQNQSPGLQYEPPPLPDTPPVEAADA